MLRKIDCVMIRVEDVDVSAAYYAKVFGLRPKWSGEGAVGVVFPETDADIVRKWGRQRLPVFIRR